MADGIAIERVGAVPFEIVKDLVDDIVLVEEDEIAAAILALLELEKTVVRFWIWHSHIGDTVVERAVLTRRPLCDQFRTGGGFWSDRTGRPHVQQATESAGTTRVVCCLSTSIVLYVRAHRFCCINVLRRTK